MTTTPEHAKHHSPLPWSECDDFFPYSIADADKRGVAICGTGASCDGELALRKHIILCVNAHDELVGALKECIDSLASYESLCDSTKLCVCHACRAIAKARAALAKAGK